MEKYSLKDIKEELDAANDINNLKAIAMLMFNKAVKEDEIKNRWKLKKL